VGPDVTLDPALTRELAERAKRELRKRMRALRAAYPATARAQRSARIVSRLLALPEVARARSIASFWPIEDRGEVDLRALDEALRAAGKSLYYPGFARDDGGRERTDLRLTESASELASLGQRFSEPPAEARSASRGQVDLIVVPALALAANGYRLGYGLGYYDSLLPDFRPPAVAVAVAFDFQLLAELPALEHDVPCDIVVTDSRTIVVGR
jgi:5-formyltetrahydrofolate cyclo-ligase